MDKHGASWMSQIGKEGIRATAEKYFNGSVGDAMAWLRKKGYEVRIARGVDERLDARIARGETCVAEELPVILEPEDDPYFPEPTRWRDRVGASRDAERDLPF